MTTGGLDWRRVLRRLVGGALLMAGMATQSVWAQPVGYTGSGQVGPITPVSGSGSGSAVYLAQGTYDLAALGEWELLASFIFNAGTGAGNGGFEFLQGGNSFSGNITTRQTVVASLPGFEITYAVTGGTGSFAGASGFGEGIIVLTSLQGVSPFPYIEAGIMNVSVVPEPATALLMFGGVVALLGRRMLRPR